MAVKTRDVVDVRQQLVLTVLLAEQYGPLEANVGDGAIAKFNDAFYFCVELGKDKHVTGHMVSGTDVKVPGCVDVVEILLGLIQLLLLCFGTKSSHYQCRFIIIFILGLCEVRLFISLLLVTLICPVPSLLAVLAFVGVVGVTGALAILLGIWLWALPFLVTFSTAAVVAIAEVVSAVS